MLCQNNKIVLICCRNVLNGLKCDIKAFFVNVRLTHMRSTSLKLIELLIDDSSITVLSINRTRVFGE